MILDPNHIGRGRGNDGFVKVSPERKTISETTGLSQIEKRGSEPSRRASTSGRYNRPRPEWPSRMRAKTSGHIRCGPTRYIARISWRSITACSGASHVPRKPSPDKSSRRVKRKPQREKEENRRDGRTDRAVRVKQTGLSWMGRKKQIGEQRKSPDNHTNRDPQMAKQPDLQFGDLRFR